MSKYPEKENKQRVLNYVKSHYSISLLNCYYVEIDKKDEELTFTTTLIKKEIGETQLFKNNICFTSIPKDNEDKSCKIEQEEQEEEQQPEQEEEEQEEEEQEEEEQDTKSKDSEEQNIYNFTNFLKERGLHSEELKFILPVKRQQIKSKILFTYT